MINRLMTMRLRSLIKRCNMSKAALISNKEKYSPEYYTKKLSEYESYIEKKEQQIVMFKKRSSQVKHVLMVVSFIALLVLLAYNIKNRFAQFFPLIAFFKKKQDCFWGMQRRN